MVHVVKIYLQSPASDYQQIRRVAVSSEIVNSYSLLAVKIAELFPSLNGREFDLGWKDPEGDFINMSSDEELAQAVANADDGLIKIFVRFVHDEETSNATANESEYKPFEVHPNVDCDGCKGIIKGFRYKCLECHDYDLCGTCNNKGIHSVHDMIKLAMPSNCQRNWAFLGFRKLWRSMFPYHSFQHGGKFKSKDVSPSEFLNDLTLNVDINGVKDVFDQFMEQFNKFTKTDQPDEKSRKNSETEVKTSKPTEGETSKPTPEDVKPLQKSEDEIPAEAEERPHGLFSNSSNGAIPKMHRITQINGNPKENSTSEGSDKEGEMSNADGWTFVNPTKEEDKVKNENSGTEKEANVNTNVEEDKKQAEVPQPDEISKPKDEEESNEANKNSEEAKKPDAPQYCIPWNELGEEGKKIANALMKMQAMGFTNEGGWLERLLLAKDGVINDALDALYPNTQRR